ncbi:MAG: dihydroorotate dehydrogenase (quinone), partial [Phenylobacterium sp.]
MSGLHDLAASALRTLDPEDAHRLTIRALALGLGPRAPRPDPILATTVAGLSLQSAVGLAAGFDKNAEVFGPMLAAGFGFVECGTVTPLPQAGNPRPRLFRLTEDRAVINRMGFNNEGLDAFAARLSRPGRPGPVGANIGANKDSADRMGDYVTGLKRLWGLADWFTLNISSPNTPGLRALQTRAALEELLGRAAEARDSLRAAGAVPGCGMVAPALEDAELGAVGVWVRAGGMCGLGG